MRDPANEGDRISTHTPVRVYRRGPRPAPSYHRSDRSGERTSTAEALIGCARADRAAGAAARAGDTGLRPQVIGSSDAPVAGRAMRVRQSERVGDMGAANAPIA
jgi:hypothetical protein